jgi:hypothetical protein
MSAKIFQFRAPEPAEAVVPGADAAVLLDAEIQRLERLDHDLQVQAHRINLSIGEVRRQRAALLKQAADLRRA